MRPAVYASVMRNRKTGTRRVNTAPHRFCKRRFCLMLSSGVCLFVPGLIVTIVGLEHRDNYDNIPGDRVLYKFIGPLSLACGVCLICVAGIYYCCWGFQSPVSSRHKKKHKKHTESSEQYDPLQPSVQTISDDRKTSPHSSDRSHGNGNHSHSHESRIGSAPVTPDQRSGRHSNGSHRHRTSSRSSTESRGHSRHSSRSRNSSNHHSNHHHSTNHSTSQSHVSPPPPTYDNQVPFIHTTAPLAQGETGSMDISIDIDTPDDTKRY